MAHRQIDLEQISLIVGLKGVNVVSLFSIISSMFTIDSVRGVLIIFSNIMSLIQATMQTIFILAGLRLAASRLGTRERNPDENSLHFY